MIALKWLGGRGSDALTGDSALLDLLMTGEQARTPPTFQVRRRSEVSHHAMAARQDQNAPAREPVLDGEIGGDGSG
jgi:hypothetical protein